MRKELLCIGDISAKMYLKQLLLIYPYAIDETMVFSLLNKTTYPHPVLLSFIQYSREIFKIHMTSKETILHPTLHKLMERMSRLSIQSGSVLHMHQFAFDATYRIIAYHVIHPYAHLPLSQVPFISELQLHTIPILSMSCYSNKVFITYSETFPLRNISMDANKFVGICIKVADKRGMVFLSKECLSFACAIAAMYPIQEPCINYDFLIIFGLREEKQQHTFYYDETNELYIGLVCGDEAMFHFLYLKEMILTLYNSICIRKHDLPIHASMIEITPQKQAFHLVFAGDTHSGKSEVLDAMNWLCRNQKINAQSFYDDSGILHYLDNVIVSTGSEVSACKDITWQSKQTLFHPMQDSIFLAENQLIQYQITPLTTHEISLQFHKVDALFYLDVSATHKGIKKIENLEEATSLFQGSKGSFYCGTCGVMQQKEAILQLLHDFFTILYIQNIPIYHVSTRVRAERKEVLFEQLSKTILKFFI